MSEVVLQTEGLSKHFGAVKAVESLDLEVRRGEVYGFLGPNGSGKTTTISMVLGLLHPSAGQVTVLGRRVTPTQTEALAEVGSLVGVPGMVPHLSGRKNLELLATLHRDVGEERIHEILELVDLTGAADRKIKGYSLGMRQRLGLGAALLHRPELLILDEPTNGLDPAGMREIRELLGRLANQGITVFLSSHLLHEVEQVCDRITVLAKGKAVATGRVEDLLGGSEVVRLRVRDTRQTADALATLASVNEIRPNGHWVEVEGAKSEDIILHLVARDLVPSEVITSKADLESVFLTLTE
ncbi:MAG TPA: ABC transporter ATP-binding protein [Thermoleophilia bacterium]|nr:ABC transporter ATP-binding protein [Thermoleophilia bacterium]